MTLIMALYSFDLPCTFPRRLLKKGMEHCIMILVNPHSHSPNPHSASAIATAWMKVKQVHGVVHGHWSCTISERDTIRVNGNEPTLRNSELSHHSSGCLFSCCTLSCDIRLSHTSSSPCTLGRCIPRLKLMQN